MPKAKYLKIFCVTFYYFIRRIKDNCIKSNITPPNYIFPIVWTILYILLIKVFKDILDSKNKLLIILFVINLLLNISWTYFYFGQKDIMNAFIIILLILATSMIILYKNNKLLYLPYIMWIGFATYLNYLSIDKINNKSEIINSNMKK